MSKTLKLTVSFPMSVVFNSATVAAVEVAREVAREALKDAAQLKGEEKAMTILFASERSTEEILEIVMRKGIRELLRKEMTSEMTNAETGVTVGDIKVAFATPMVPRSCDRCIKDKCQLDARLTNSGCQFKKTGIREACVGPRWTKTV